MFRVLVYIVIFGMLFSGVECYAFGKTKEPVQSTQGIELNNDIVKSAKISFKGRQKYNKKRKTSMDYIKAKKQIKRVDALKEKKQKDLEFLQDKLDKKKEKLEVLTSEELKGENK